jgi:CheY-like chemotaxis protein
MAIPRVLVVDDDPGFGEFVRKVAHGCGFDVELAGGADAFRRNYAARAPDLIMLDLQMPGTDGIELLRSLAELGCTAPILVMSGFDAKIVDTARRLGEARGLRMHRVLTKPIRAADLRQILNDFLAEFTSDVR